MADPAHQDIIIIRRRGDQEEGHHGGAWKIALADFMTAMMALFLVMWLINSTSKAQKQSIAEYFNPVKLAEVTNDRKGLRDPRDAPAEAGAEGGAEGRGGEGKADGPAGREPGAPGSRARESALFQDPYAVLARLASEAERGEGASGDASALESGEPGVSGGEAARDPFDPLYWQVEPLPRHRTDRPGALDTAAAAPADGRLDARGQAVQAPRPRDRTRAGEAPRETRARLASAEALPLAPPEAPRGQAAAPREAAVREAASRSPAAPDPGPEAPLREAADREAGDRDAKAAETAAAAEVKAAVARAVQASAGAPAPRVEVRRTREGILISITDEIDFSMFGIGSAEPTPKVVRALERIAKVLGARPGRIVVRGHTDGRPFRSETYDNWRLSSARAQMASYMLVRGGLDEGRIERIEGHADRQPRNPADPKAAENRRIEILLRGRPE
ncbi:hypothetical protein OPKNFCMD_5588 [Methylobacterium crusticola]|uniref:OmpA-like domain-containing protein n=1 Tax=Methylobacterium crusticola TaxID=1697972 RepID=A0ABQ4R7S0_9HYPH|nr:MotB family protein [Methylobacterium crusticola]GJD52821.1 hypothetical protein OPKNFCMD_5588 [Methylobacterium crusticola]